VCKTKAPDTYQASLQLERSKAEALSTALSEFYCPPATAIGLAEMKGGTWELYAYFAEPPDEKAFLGFLKDNGTECKVAICKLPPTDWVAESQAGLPPVRAGRFRIHGSHDRGSSSPGRWKIEVDAGQAFGTAHHGSTRGCLMALDILAKRKHFTRILDIGTGTGILAIAAARAWRTRVLASDTDPVAVGIARQNITLNAACRYIRTITATGLSHPAIRQAAPYDLVFANILAQPLSAMAHDISRSMCTGGTLILSGITLDQVKRVAAAYRAAAFAKDEYYSRIALEEWATLIFTKTG